MNDNNEILKLYGYVQASTYRVRVVEHLGETNVSIPRDIANSSNIRINHISKVLKELKHKKVVECINEEARKGRLYKLTPKGKDVLETIKQYGS